MISCGQLEKHPTLAMRQGLAHHFSASRVLMIQNIPPMDRLLRPSVCVLVGSSATAVEQDIGACLAEIFPEKHWRLIVHEAHTSHEIVSTVRNERVHLALLLLKSIDYTALRKAVIGPASDLGMIRILRSAWNIPIIAIAGCPIENDHGEEALG
jgi:hypothetical protein